RRAERLAELLAELIEVLRQHPPPRGPVVDGLGTPGVNTVRHALAPKHVGKGPGLADVLVSPLAGSEDHAALLKDLEVVAAEAGDEFERGGEVEVLGPAVLEEPSEPVGATHPDRRLERVGEPAQQRD